MTKRQSLDNCKHQRSKNSSHLKFLITFSNLNIQKGEGKNLHYQVLFWLINFIDNAGASTSWTISYSNLTIDVILTPQRNLWSHKKRLKSGMKTEKHRKPTSNATKQTISMKNQDIFTWFTVSDISYLLVSNYVKIFFNNKFKTIGEIFIIICNLFGSFFFTLVVLCNLQF